MTTQQVTDFSAPDEGELVAVEVDGTEVAVTVVAGELHAFDDTCPHAGCSLAEGDLDGRTVVCPCHLARFDITTGAVLEGPTQSGVGIWSARLVDGTLELDGPRDTAEPLAAPSAAAPGAAPASVEPGAAPSPTSGPDQDITVIIEREHDAFRRQFDALEGLSTAGELDGAWTALVELLEIHASGEETVLYPHLARAAEHGVEETEHAVRDHNEIRDSIRAVQEHRVGSEAWWAAVRTAREVNEDHLREEEQDVLPVFRDSIDLPRRAELGEQWRAFHYQHTGARGLSLEHTDPQAVVEQQHDL